MLRGQRSILLKQIAKNNRLYIYIVKIIIKKKKIWGALPPRSNNSSVPECETIGESQYSYCETL